jgi:hypothetical protein
MVNGMGGTPISELYLLYRHLHEQVTKRGMKVKRNYVGNFCTSLEITIRVAQAGQDQVGVVQVFFFGVRVALSNNSLAFTIDIISSF